MNTQEEFEKLLQSELEETGQALAMAPKKLAAYMAERATHLSMLKTSGEPGFERALRAETRAIALKAGIVASGELDGIDNRIFGIIQGALTLAVAAL